MSTQGTNLIRQLSFSGASVEATIVENASNHLVDARTIVINPSASDVFAGESPRCIPAFSSAILADTIVDQAELLILLRVDEDAATADVKEEPGWALYCDLDSVFPRDVPLWRSSQDDAGTIAFDAAPVLENTTAHKVDTFRLKVNLWFAPPGTNCLVHNEHDFIEVHTQVKGTGRMQKFAARDLATMYEDVPMTPGFTNPAPFCGIGVDSPFVYPWHQYRADSDCIWLVVEYHLAA